MSKTGGLELAREFEAGERFADYDFTREVKDTSPWEVDGDEWVMRVYLENGDEPSTKVFFSVKFAPDSAQVLSAEVLH